MRQDELINKVSGQKKRTKSGVGTHQCYEVTDRGTRKEDKERISSG